MNPYNVVHDLALILGVLFIFFLVSVPAKLWVIWREPHPETASSTQLTIVPEAGITAETFYGLLHKRMKDIFTESRLPFSDIRFGPRKLHSRRTIFSRRSVYLEVRYLDYSYLVFCYPVGRDLFVSNWLYSNYETWLTKGVFQYWQAWKRTNLTLFQHDLVCLFHDRVAKAFNEVIDELRAEQGLMPLEDNERRPILRGFYADLRGGEVGIVGGSIPIQRRPATEERPRLEQPAPYEGRPETGPLVDLIPATAAA